MGHTKSPSSALQRLHLDSLSVRTVVCVLCLHVYICTCMRVIHVQNVLHVCKCIYTHVYVWRGVIIAATLAERALALCQAPAMCSRGSFFHHPSKPRTGGLGLRAASACVRTCVFVVNQGQGYSQPSASSQLSPPCFSLSSSHQSRLQGRMSGFCASKRYLVTGWRLVTNLLYLCHLGPFLFCS